MNATAMFALIVIAVLTVVHLDAKPQTGSSAANTTPEPCNPAAAVRSGVNTTFAWIIISSFQKSYDAAEANCRSHCATLVKIRPSQVDQDSLGDEVAKDDVKSVRPAYWVASETAGTCRTMRVEGERRLVIETAPCDQSLYYVCEMPDPFKQFAASP